MKIRIGFNGSFTGLLYSAGKLNLKTEREKRESRTCWRASASKDVLSRPPRRTSSHDVRNHHLHNARNCRDADELMAQRYHETIFSPQRETATQRGERKMENFPFSKARPTHARIVHFRYFERGITHCPLFARCTRDASASTTSFLIIVSLINYSYSLLNEFGRDICYHCFTNSIVDRVLSIRKDLLIRL